MVLVSKLVASEEPFSAVIIAELLESETSRVSSLPVLVPFNASLFLITPYYPDNEAFIYDCNLFSYDVSGNVCKL